MKKEVFMKIIKPQLLFLSLFFLFLSPSLFALQIGDAIPGFSVISGDGHILIRDDLLDKKGLIFYEDRSLMDINQDLKDYLKALNLDKNNIMTVVVVDCNDLGLFKKLWQDRLVDHSRKINLPVYGDWNGKMKDRFKLEDESSTFMVIDETGHVVYSQTGTIASSDFEQIGNLVH
jgi:hypothetical protein